MGNHPKYPGLVWESFLYYLFFALTSDNFDHFEFCHTDFKHFRTMPENFFK